MSTVLLVEDNPHIMKINTEMFAMQGYHVLRASTAAECRKALHWHPVDIVVLDILLPDGNGVELCREIKEQYRVPILFLSALGTSQDVVKGLRSGGDDYLAKPYDLEVLVARVEARLRQEQRRERYVCYGSLKLDTLSGCGYLDNTSMQLTQKEFSVLLMLTRRAETVVSKQEILEEIWNQASQENLRALWTLISRLRKKLESEHSRIEIASRRDTGYILEQI